MSFVKEGSSLKVMDTKDYYPFGMSFLKPDDASIYDPLSVPYNYKYNGKELQETGMYDYGARFYMPDIGRWGVVDPLAEVNRAWSPYRYAYNNPIIFIDPDGRLEDWYQDDVNGNIAWHDGSAERAGQTNITQKADGKQILVKELNGQGNTVAVNNLNNDGSITRNGQTITNGYSTETVLGRTITSRAPYESIVNADLLNGVPFNITPRGIANGMEKTGTAIEVAGIVGLIPSEGSSSLLLPIGTGMNMSGTILNAGLDFSEGKNAEGINRLVIMGATAGLGTAIKSISNSARLEKSSEKILKAHNVIYGEIADKTREVKFKK